jgi:hypothetical protein
MRKLCMVAVAVFGLAAVRDSHAQAGISLGAAVGSSWLHSKLSGDDLHGLVYLRLGLPLVPYGARGDFLVLDRPDADYDFGVIGSAVVSLNAPLVQPYALVGVGRYGFGDGATTGVSFGGGLKVGGRRGLFLEARRHDPINRTLVSLGLAF